jgi:amino acid permease
MRHKLNVPWFAVLISASTVGLAYMHTATKSTAKYVHTPLKEKPNQKIFQFLLNMVGVSIVIPWAILCFTYLLFRSALKAKGLNSVAEAESPLQPALAIWGLFWSIVVASSQGFKAFLGPHSSYWSQTSSS